MAVPSCETCLLHPDNLRDPNQTACQVIGQIGTKKCIDNSVAELRRTALNFENAMAESAIWWYRRRGYAAVNNLYKLRGHRDAALEQLDGVTGGKSNQYGGTI
jgi:hypothetical protein